MKVLITGSHGFVGRHFVKKLDIEGNTLVLVDDLSNGKRMEDWLPHLRPDNCEFRQYFIDCQDYFTSYEDSRFDLVVHCAGIIGGREVIEGDPIQHVKNIKIDAAFFDWACREVPGKIIYMSSSAAYPVDLQNKEKRCTLFEEDIDLTNLRPPDMTYGWSKLQGEYLLNLLADRYGLSVLTLRPFSGYGEDMGMEYPIPAICQRVVNREDPLIVWGSGQQGRDFVHVDDIVNFALCHKSYMPYEAFNVSSGQITNFINVAKMAAEIVGYRPTIKPLTDKPEGVYYRVGDNTNMMHSYGGRELVPLRMGLSWIIKYLEEKNG